MDIQLIYVVKTLLLPPAGLLLLALVGLVLVWRKRRIGMSLIAVVLVLLVLASLPVVGHLLARPLEQYPAIAAADLTARSDTAIVVLGGGRYLRAPEYGGADTARGLTLQRLRYAAVLQRQSGLPLLVTGGTVLGEGDSEAVIMKAILEQEFSVPVNWQEDRSRNTAENARFTGDILRQQGIRRIVLVTHALHMTRAVQQFSRQGLELIPAPLGFTTHNPPGRSVFDWIPSVGGLTLTSAALHEYLGLIWYRLRYQDQ